MNGPPLATLPVGVAVGERLDGVDVYRWVPYAEPASGAARFAPPRPRQGHLGRFDATRFGPAAPQAPVPPGASLVPGMGVGATAEDCLWLAVWVPHDLGDRPADGWPVVVWVHGGAFATGSPSQPTYDGAALARRGRVVVVAPAYRLGVLGFAAVWALDDPPPGAAPNAGLLDQRAALRWVRRHAGAFGGDPARVTVAGESAGGGSALHLLAAPDAPTLADRAICQSGATGLTLDVPRARRVALSLLAALGLGAGDAARLVDVDIADLVAAGADVAALLAADVGLMPFHPVVDGTVVPDLPVRALAGGSAAGVPLVIGTTLDEMRLYASLDPGAATLDRARLVRRVARSVRPGHPDPAAAAEQVVSAYEAARRGTGPAAASAPDVWQAVTTDVHMRLPALDVAAAQAAHAPVWAYVFTWPAADPALGACHAIDLPFTFDTWDAAWTAFCGADERAHRLTHRVQDAWAAFAWHGDPSTPGLRWPRWAPPVRTTMLLGGRCGTVDDPGGAERAAWEGVRVPLGGA